MINGPGGYVMYRLPDGTALTANTAKTVISLVDDNAKLKQFDKPVIFDRFTFTLGGGSREMSGPSVHTVEAGVHKHYIGPMVISVLGDTSISMKHE